MSLRFIIGRAGSGKTHACLEEIAKKQDAGRCLFLVPEQFTSEAERLLCGYLQGNGLLSAEVLSFGRLAHQLHVGKGQDAFLLGDTGKSMVLRRLLLEEKQNLQYYETAADKTGFVEELSGLISEFFHYCIAPEELEERAQQESLSPVMRGKLQDLALLYRKYLAYLDQDYISSDETLGLLAKKLETMPEEKGFSIWMDGFYGFTPLEYTVLTQLLRISDQLTVTLTMDRDSYYSSQSAMSMSTPFYEPWHTMVKLRDLAQSMGIPVETPLSLTENRRTDSAVLSSLEQRFFSHRSGGFAGEIPENTLSLYAAPTRRAELHFVAGKITELVRNGLRYRDIAILTNGLSIYEKSLQTIFREYDIPCFLDAKRSIASHPLVHLVCGYLDILSFDFRYEGMFSYLKSGMVPIEREDLDRLENYVLAYGIKGKKWKLDDWTFGLDLSKETDRAEREKINALRQQVMAPFTPVLAMQKNKTYTIRHQVKQLLHHLSLLGVPETLENMVLQAEADGQPETARVHRQVWQILMDLTEKLSHILGQAKVTPGEFSKILEAGLTQSKLGIIPPTVDCLIVGDLERSRLPEIKVLFVLGVNEGILPAPPADGGILTDLERDVLAQEGTHLAPNSRSRLFEERYLIYRALTKPSQRLILTYAEADTQGKALFPSSLIDQLKRMFPTLRTQPLPAADPVRMSKAAALHYISQSLSQKESLTPLYWEIYRFFAGEDTSFRQRLALILSGNTAKPQRSYLSSKTVHALYGNSVYSAVSRLERYAACPFAFFAEYGLKAKERKLYRLQTPDLGILFHQVLELFANTLEGEGKNWTTLSQQETTERIYAAVDAAAPSIGQNVLLETAANRYLIERLKKVSSRAAWALVRHVQSGEFLPEGSEIAFGPADSLPPIRIELADGKELVLSGKIDRVDLLEKDGRRYVKIIDYKSGTKSFSLRDVYYGLQLQLLIYLDAYLSYFPQAKTAPGGVFYFRIQDPSITLEEETAPEKIADALYAQMEMSGVVLQQEDVLMSMDHAFRAEDGSFRPANSVIIPVSFTSKGTISARSSALEETEFRALLRYAVKKTADLGEAMLSGDITPAPVLSSSGTPCSYCKFHAICRYDYDTRPAFRNLSALSDAQKTQMLSVPTEYKDGESTDTK